jgi:hypothetical protein
MHRHPVALLLLMLVLTACDGLSVESGGPQLPNTCLVTPDEPHKSVTSRENEIVGKGWFICSVALQDATLDVQLERRSGDGWDLVARLDKEFTTVPVRRKGLLPVPTACKNGTFRTAARLASHDTQGVYNQSHWYYSKQRTDPCGRL